MEFTVLVAKGLEEVLVAELRGLGIAPKTVAPGSVRFLGNLSAGYRAVAHLRSARRVLVAACAFEAHNPQSLYEGVKEFPWEEWLSPQTTFAVEASVRDSFTGHSGFLALKTKDAIADRCREWKGSRPDVDRRDPAVRVFVHLAGTRAEVGLDLGGALHKRGYRVKPSPGALNETLAAGILLLMGYDGTVPFADPFCGSGTFAAEASFIAQNLAPALIAGTRRFPLERWPSFDAFAWKEILKEAQDSRRNPPAGIWCSDRDPKAVTATNINLEWAGLSTWVKCTQRDACDFVPKAEGGLMVSNPPYGDHCAPGEDLGPLYKGFGDMLKQRCAGWTAALLVGEPSLGKQVGLRPSRRIPVFNGPLEARLLVYTLYAGSKTAAATDRLAD